MKQEIKKVGDDLVITLTVPYHSKRSNPYDESEHSQMENIVGVVAGDELNFSHWIDMAYKDKSDQISIPFYIYQGTEKEFRILCEGLGIEIFTYPLCAKCHKVIYGTSTYMKEFDGPICFDCDHER
jgi:hypothetical protein